MPDPNEGEFNFFVSANKQKCKICFEFGKPLSQFKLYFTKNQAKDLAKTLLAESKLLDSPTY